MLKQKHERCCSHGRIHHSQLSPNTLQNGCKIYEANVKVLLNRISNMLSWMNSLLMTANTLQTGLKIYEANAKVHLNRNSTLHSWMSSSLTTANKHVSKRNYMIMQSEKRFQIHVRPNNAQHSIGKMHKVPNIINTVRHNNQQRSTICTKSRSTIQIQTSLAPALFFLELTVAGLLHDAREFLTQPKTFAVTVTVSLIDHLLKLLTSLVIEKKLVFFMTGKNSSSLTSPSPSRPASSIIF